MTKTELFFFNSLNNLLCASIDKPNIKKISSCIALLWQQGCFDTYKQLNADICSYWSQIPWRALKIWRWRVLYRVAMTNGMFELALILREKYKTSIKKTIDKKYMWRKLQCAFEDDELKKAQELIEEIRLSQNYVNYCSNDIKKAELFLNILKNEKKPIDESAFFNYIRGKKIQILGPIGKEDNIISDIKIRLNENCIREGKDKPDIVYYNGEHYETIYKNKKEILRAFTFVVVKKFLGNEDSNIREFVNFQSLLLVGFPQMIPLVLCDLNVGAPRSIYVTGVNLFTTQKVHNESYMSANLLSLWKQVVSIGNYSRYDK